jgi:hypothetical protein
MAYSNFTLSKVKEDFQLSVIEGIQFLPTSMAEIVPSPILKGVLEDLPWAIAVDTEKARSEVIINPVLLEVRRIFEQRISVFSGEEFNVDSSLGLNGVCDFLISGSKEQLSLEAPTIVVVEAKKSDLKSGMGQCIAEMVAAQQFNSKKKHPISKIFGSVTSGTSWRFMQLENQTVTIDLHDYPLPPVGNILAALVWMVEQSSIQRSIPS